MIVRQLNGASFEVSCDQCEKLFVRIRSKLHELNFCCVPCQRLSNRKGGKLLAKARTTLLRNYGVENQLQIPGMREKLQDGLIKRFGEKTPFKDTAIKEKSSQTLLAHYGVDNPTKSEEVRAAKRQNSVAKYGVEHPMQRSDVKAKFDWKLNAAKRHETMKSNGTYGKETLPELLCYDALCSIFGIDNTEKHVSVNGWDIDFYVKSEDVYVQEDGVYYHGLDRPIDVIAEHKTKRDVVIHGTYERDREQNHWFLKRGLTLVRFTDKELLEWQKQAKLQEMIRSRINRR